MAPRMAERLGQARARSFVGRQRELDWFSALVSMPGEPAVVMLYGPAGIGKSTLLRQFASRAAELGAYCLYIDARDLPPTLDALAARLNPLLDAESDRRTVVLIDAYDLLVELDAALRDELAPRLPADVVLVLAGQRPPSVGWRSDDGWAPLLHPMKLDNLTRAECGRYLEARGVPAELQAAAIAFTHGHPLALALVGEVVKQKGTLAQADSADVVRVLIDSLLDKVPTPTHRAALEAAAQVRVVDEPLLGALLNLDEVSELFAWMRGLPFADAGPQGLYLHDLARDVLAADLRWRHAQRYAEFHDRARQHYLARLDSADPRVQATALLDLIFLHPDLRIFLMPPDDSAPLRIEAALPSDVEPVTEMVGRHEGVESAAHARHWLTERLDTWLVVRGSDGAAYGAACLLPVETVGETNDPAVDAARAELLRHPPLRPGETATLFRFWLGRDSYQSVSPAQSLIATQFARHFLTTPGLAVTLMPFARPEDWQAFCAYADQRRAPAGDFTVGSHSYATFVHDWRIVPPAAWVARLSQQELGAPPTARSADSKPVLVLSEGEFAAAVRQGLRDYPRADRLRTNPLLRCRLVTTRLSGTESPAEQAEVLKAVLKEAVETLTAVPADRRLHRVLVRAYLAPAPTLERAAEVLELPSSTFRRLLSTAVSRVTTVLWHRELDA